ncbi:inositol monophosphatase family protein [Parvularcula dongshanensis]|uniref:Inositol-1-monophosphatase n=1 Tax=Parvularcula dongshanensis TaxID=1173995 RepID=A0A840I063_9PROT|nr:inositol monophosphatase family protein [Parvularcula dongshanensis]MBB4657663.1 myo-inositol-1(or 4)-monophosphatase [Parvularcula dongshanensis]
MPHLSPLLTVMTNAARDAAKVLRRDFFEVEALQVRRKGAADFVTKADLAAEEAIVRSLQKARPKYGLVLEEQGEIEGSDNSNRFIVDPLDGTTNFLHGIPQFCVSIALERDREPFAGVVFAPITDEMFYAERGFGAFVNDRRLRVSGREDLSEALFGTGFPWKGKSGRGQSLKETDRVLAETAGVRRFGSAAYDLCMVGAGRLDGYWERGIQPWDVAAGIVIAREAGGEVTTIAEGKARPHLEGNVLATNHLLHDAARRLIEG